MISQHIQQEYFFFNPIYSALIDKREKIFEKNLEALLHQEQEEDGDLDNMSNIVVDKIKLYTSGLPSISQTVRYRKDRDKIAKIISKIQQQHIGRGKIGSSIKVANFIKGK